MKFKTILNHMADPNRKWPKKTRSAIKYRHTESGEVKTKAQWIKELAPIARDQRDGFEFSATDLFNAEVEDGKLIQVRG